ncbi:hypothetical protein [Candidatus Enterococcus ikei]|uniref:Uncharacterized protein n=1 Tax=Candidatus Enterococcus ikei TaxID=2815326 RepID=A0ABS3GVA5_9ENTE|nr:hypothetical protein [Enterococcus sp. DIV0869a]MBO0439187.1 hypothetical protein [Enterococcus sp. DIV0869a]
MADIVQLEEKGNLLYPKTHTSAIDNFDEAVVKKTGNETINGIKNFTQRPTVNGKDVLFNQDTGWIPLKWAKNFRNYGNNAVNAPKIRCKNGIITLIAAANPVATIPKEIYDYPFIEGIPQEFIPNDLPLVSCVSQGSGKAMFFAKLDNGKRSVMIERYRDDNGFLAIETNFWLPVCLTWQL